ncbi:CRISPR-associated helicase/endonuclease Cas3 [Candidatus Magnetobacterium casense]|uniref:CRISPR-associated helicase/endonuclease Cas3 n=1 Tax=Candidatus Magnetobacterium casense TaxID=1455061 RepID=UPI000591436E|nr:CRISPR-associated helicase/endonuclease Cas3 [Candidatus Magnetobacterium casensis]
MPVYAKSDPPETIETHNRNLLACYETLKPYLDPEKVNKYDAVIKKILCYHDLGKLNHKFQNKLGLQEKAIIPELKDAQEIPHEWLSVAFITSEDNRYFHGFSTENIRFYRLVQYCVAFHHTRSDKFNKEAVIKFIELDLEKNKDKIGFTSPLNADYDIEKDLRQLIESQAYYRHYFELIVFFKGILHKCDYTASAGIDAERLYRGNYRDDFARCLAGKVWTLKPFQQEARRLAAKNIILVAATGSGKTEYSMNWIDGAKAFYLLGLKMAVSEMHKRFREVFAKDDNNNVSLLHGDIAYNLEDTDNTETYTERIETARKLCAPLTVATADQLVTAAFKYNGYELVYLTASYSKIVVDEIQSFSPDSIAAIVVFLKEIHRLGGKFLLMTATLPPFVKEELEALGNVEIPSPVLPGIRRHRISVHGEEINDPGSLAMVIDSLETGRKVLVVCNTVRRAQEMYEALRDEGACLLHSRFIQRDRKLKETAIMAINDPTHPPVVWIATQVVEASLDLDFDVLFTECSPVDSLFQRFGRCYRKREYGLPTPNIHIFHAKTFKVYDADLMARTYRHLKDRYDGLFMTEEDKQATIEHIFRDIETTQYYRSYKNYKNLLELGFKAQTKKEAQEMFRKIAFNYCVIPRPVYNACEKEITEALGIIEAKGVSFDDRLRAKAELRQYTVAVQLFDRKRLMRVAGSAYCNRNAICIINDVTYSFEKGIELNEAVGAGVFID